MDASLWFREAQAKLQDATAAREKNRHGAACFWAQQAAELALKAVFLNQQNRAPPRVHDISMLAAEVKAPLEIRKKGGTLTPAYTGARYLDVAGKPSSELYSAKDADQALSIAKEVLAWCASKLQ